MKWSWDRFLVAVMERAPQALFVHTRMVLVALIAAIVISVPIGVLLTRPRLKWLGGIILNILNLLQTFPGLAIVALAMPILGMGFKPAVFALIIQGLLPIARNTIAGLYGVDPDIMEAARGMGMAERKILYEVEIPLAMPVILAGIRTSAVYVVSVATLAAYIGGGGLGDLIVSGSVSYTHLDVYKRQGQDRDNYIWVRDAQKHDLVVGSQARILYQDAAGRVRIALKFNEMVRRGEIGPVMIGRDHHDVSGTDSPFRETANIKDGSNVMADMAAQCYAGNAARGMNLVALHNGGGVGIGKAVNGGFGLVLDGSGRVDETIKSALLWDVTCGVARRAWARNENSLSTGIEFNSEYEGTGQITLPYLVKDELIDTVTGPLL